jgi:hypothetical protein
MARMDALWPHHSGATQAALPALSTDPMARLRTNG